jgi:hypothetical protein
VFGEEEGTTRCNLSTHPHQAVRKRNCVWRLESCLVKWRPLEDSICPELELKGVPCSHPNIINREPGVKMPTERRIPNPNFTKYDIPIPSRYPCLPHVEKCSRSLFLLWLANLNRRERLWRGGRTLFASLLYFPILFPPQAVWPFSQTCGYIASRAGLRGSISVNRSMGDLNASDVIGSCTLRRFSVGARTTSAIPCCSPLLFLLCMPISISILTTSGLGWRWRTTACRLPTRM